MLGGESSSFGAPAVANMQKIVGSNRTATLQGMLIRNRKVLVPERTRKSRTIRGKRREKNNTTWQRRRFIFNTIFLAEMHDLGCGQNGKFGITGGL